MALEQDFITLADLLEERGETEQDEEILSRIKVLAQEHLPDGWTLWQVCRASREEIFGEQIEASVLNRLVFALPTVGIARAFNPDADHLSEIGYRQMCCKLLDWAFARALIIGPPAVANKIRGSAARTELFKESVRAMKPLLHTRAEADKILASVIPDVEETKRKRRSTSTASSCKKLRKSSRSRSTSQNERLECLERKLENMYSFLLQKIELKKSTRSTIRKLIMPTQAPKGRPSAWRSRPTAPTHASSTRTSSSDPPGGSKSLNKQHNKSQKEEVTKES